MSDSQVQSEWTSADAWILAATETGRGQRLTHLIGAADAISHAIPTRDEISSAVGALRAAGLLECEGDRISLTREGRKIRRHWKGGMFNWGPTLLPRLALIPRSDELYPVTEEDWEAAYREYIAR